MPPHPRNPYLTVDIIIEYQGGLVLIQRKNPPHGWALPGGFVDYGECLEEAAKREAKEETSLNVHLVRQLHTYSSPDRDPRHHTVSTVFIARATGDLAASDDATHAGVFTAVDLPTPLVFDHAKILNDYFNYKDSIIQYNDT
ncbi:MAG: NUDIX hydrolase [Desulfosarcinaceae bacterium]|jgi:ADP-ribose pyrophosphatase YjhB (NUDIX family)